MTSKATLIYDRHRRRFGMKKAIWLVTVFLWGGAVAWAFGVQLMRPNAIATWEVGEADFQVVSFRNGADFTAPGRGTLKIINMSGHDIYVVAEECPGGRRADNAPRLSAWVAPAAELTLDSANVGRAVHRAGDKTSVTVAKEVPGWLKGTVRKEIQEAITVSWM